MCEQTSENHTLFEYFKHMTMLDAAAVAATAAGPALDLNLAVTLLTIGLFTVSLMIAIGGMLVAMGLPLHGPAWGRALVQWVLRVLAFGDRGSPIRNAAVACATVFIYGLIGWVALASEGESH